MGKQAAELLKKALALPANERAELAGTLINSLDTTRDEGVEAASQAEIARRIEDVRSGKVRTVPRETVRKKARKLLHGPATH